VTQDYCADVVPSFKHCRSPTSQPRIPATKSSIAVLSPRLVRNSKSRQRLREPLLAGFDFCTDVSLLAALRRARLPTTPEKPLEHFRPTKLGSSESLFAPGLGHVEAGVLEEDSRPVSVRLFFVRFACSSLGLEHFDGIA
jgi:hypothetical protein